MRDDWNPIETAPEDEMVMTKIDDERGVRNEQPLLKKDNLWWIGKGGKLEMYVYYSPTHWR